MGKSALTWKWFNQIAPNEMKPLAGRLWWSFYESDATFENFLIRALCYVSGDSEDAVRALPWPERETRLLRHLNEKPYLFVLDGLERILIAYNRMDASRLADDDYDQQTANDVVGAVGLPTSAAQSFVGQHRLRQTTDPRAGAFLQRLAQVAKSRILITTRLYPSELQMQTGHPRPGCFAHFLSGLSDDDALDLWRAFEVAGSRVELVPIFRSVESHPLLVQALASEVANYKRAPGDFAKWREDHPQFDPTSLSLVQSRTHILEFALKGLSPKVREVLHTLVGFRMPASYATLEALLVGPDKACNSAQELDRALTELEDRGLIGWDREANRYDAHPIVRGVVWQLTDAKDRARSTPRLRPISSRWRHPNMRMSTRSRTSPRRSSATTRWWAWAAMTTPSLSLATGYGAQPSFGLPPIGSALHGWSGCFRRGQRILPGLRFSTRWRRATNCPANPNRAVPLLFGGPTRYSDDMNSTTDGKSASQISAIRFARPAPCARATASFGGRWS